MVFTTASLLHLSIRKHSWDMGSHKLALLDNQSQRCALAVWKIMKLIDVSDKSPGFKRWLFMIIDEPLNIILKSIYNLRLNLKHQIDFLEKKRNPTMAHDWVSLLIISSCSMFDDDCHASLDYNTCMNDTMPGIKVCQSLPQCCTISFILTPYTEQHWCNDLTIGWNNWNLLSYPNTTLVPQARQAMASGENLNYLTLAPQARQARPSGEILNYSLSR